MDALRDAKDRQGKLVVVTGITPTPAGEGKTTTAIGLTQGMGRLGHKVVVNLREPTLGPIFGIKGGGTGGGNARIVPEDEINIHFTGDAHAVASAHNLLAALVDNAVFRNAIPDFEATGIHWTRVTDASDRGLRQVVAGVGGTGYGPLREARFDIVSASEIMAILALTDGPQNLRERISRIVVGVTRGGEPVSVGRLGVEGSLMTLPAPDGHAQPRADHGRPARRGTRRALRQHRPRLQLHTGRQAGRGIRRLCHYRGRVSPLTSDSRSSCTSRHGPSPGYGGGLCPARQCWSPRPGR